MKKKTKSQITAHVDLAAITTMMMMIKTVKRKNQSLDQTLMGSKTRQLITLNNKTKLLVTTLISQKKITVLRLSRHLQGITLITPLWTGYIG